MKQMKKLSVLAAGSIAIGLQLFTSMALAEEVCLEGDTVMGIKGMDVLTDAHGPITIDVKFTYATGYEVYNSGLDNFPFPQANKEEDLIAMNAQINDLLDATNPTPGSVGQPSQNVYYIGAEEDEGLIGAYGSENSVGIWEQCTQLNDCILGVAILNPNERHTYAELSSATGGKCGNIPPDETDPPGTSYPIAPCISGSWYLPARDGEGYVIEIIGPELEQQMLAYFYTYDEAGNQIWMIGGQAPFNGDTAVLPMLITSGASYGDDFDPDDVLRESWGTLTFKFTSKNAGTVLRESTMGFGTDTVDIERLTSVTGLVCP
jgi:hypothetical protein